MADYVHWIEAEQWLAHHYPEHKWKAWISGVVICIKQYNYTTDKIHMGSVHQDSFREWISRTDFHTAMNHLLIVTNIMHFTETNIIKYRK